MCKRYPISRHVKLVEFLLGEVSKEPASEDFKHGILLCFLGIIKMKRAFIDNNTDPMKKASLRILKFCLDNVDSKNHTIASSSIDVINQFLIDYPTCDFLWTSSYCELWGTKTYSILLLLCFNLSYELFIIFIDSITRKIAVIVFDDVGARLSTKSSALGTLGLLFRQRPASTRGIVVPEPAAFGSMVEKLMEEHDQLFKDNFCSFLAGVIVGHLKYGHYNDLRLLLDIPTVVSQIISIFEDPSSMPGRPLCAALPELVNAFAETSLPELHKCAEDIVTALLRTKVDRYWRVQVDVAKALGAIDYHAFCAVVARSLSMHTVQSQSIDLVARLLESNDSKVQTGAAEALVEMAGLLCTETTEVLLLVSCADIWPTHPIVSASRGVEFVMNLLVQKTLVSHPKSLQKGVYRALHMLYERYGSLSGDSYESPNPLGAYASELVPLLLERLSGSALALDLECHVDMLSLLGLLARENKTHFGCYAKGALEHCLRLMNIITRIMDTHAPQPSKEFVLGIENLTLQKGTPVGLVGVCDKLPTYQEIYAKLSSTYMITSSGSSGSVDKFSEMRPLVIRTTTAILGCMDSGALVKYRDEILFYLASLYFHEPCSVLECTGMLFQTLFSEKVATVKCKFPRDKEGIFATWTDFCESRARRVPNANSLKHPLVYDFEFFVRTAMKTYLISVDEGCKASVLKFITTLVKCGVLYKIFIFI